MAWSWQTCGRQHPGPRLSGRAGGGAVVGTVVHDQHAAGRYRVWLSRSAHLLRSERPIAAMALTAPTVQELGSAAEFPKPVARRQRLLTTLRRNPRLVIGGGLVVF